MIHEAYQVMRTVSRIERDIGSDACFISLVQDHLLGSIICE